MGRRRVGGRVIGNSIENWPIRFGFESSETVHLRPYTKSLTAESNDRSYVQLEQCAQAGTTIDNNGKQPTASRVVNWQLSYPT